MHPDIAPDTDPRGEPNEETYRFGGRRCRSCDDMFRPVVQRGLCEACLDVDDESRYEYRQRRTA